MFYGRKELEDILDEADLHMLNAWSFAPDVSKEDLAKIMDAASKKRNELILQGRELVQNKYKKQNKRLVRGEIIELLHEKELSKEDYVDILLMIHSFMREKNQWQL